jgi:LmbE family N-acetylglucosaminyl deacetylase
MNVLVIAPHPDDEVLGCGGTIHRLVGRGHRVTVAIVTRGWSPLYCLEEVEQVRGEARRASERLGVAELRFMDLPSTGLKDLPANTLNDAFRDLVRAIVPEWVFLPFPGDRHEDHRQAYAAACVALRPTRPNPAVTTIACYETPSETHWHSPGLEPAFDPNWFVDISEHLDAKLQALQCYGSQLKGGDSPPARQPDAVRSLARWRGATVGLAAAEAFFIVRRISPASALDLPA